MGRSKEEIIRADGFSNIIQMIKWNPGSDVIKEEGDGDIVKYYLNSLRNISRWSTFTVSEIRTHVKAYQPSDLDPNLKEILERKSQFLEALSQFEGQR